MKTNHEEKYTRAHQLFNDPAGNRTHAYALLSSTQSIE